MQVFKAAASLEAPTKLEDDEGGLIESLAVEGRPDETAAQVSTCAFILLSLGAPF